MRSLNLLGIFLALPLLLILGAVPKAHAARAAFTQDGNTIYLAAGVLKKLDLAHPDHFDEITTSPLFGGEAIHAVTRLNDGRILCLSSHHLVAFDPKNQEFAKFYDCDIKKESFDDLTADLSTARILVQGGGNGLDLVCFLPNDPTPMHVANRRVREMESPIFDRQGNLYFSSYGDLWGGGIYLEKLDDSGTSTAANMRGILTGARIAPLARLETYEGTPEGTRVMEIAPAGPLLYLHTQRMYGTGWGMLMTMATPPPNEAHEDGDYEDFIKALSSIKVIDTASIATWLCVSADEKKIFYQLGQSHWLIENGAQPRKLPVHGYIWP